jgi:predicted Zn-dependent protease with MMP-like domain
MNCYLPDMRRAFWQYPDAAEIEAMARTALAQLPAVFREHLADIVLQVEEFADAQVLAELGIADPLGLTGLYEGVPLGSKSIDASGMLPDRIRLFRAALLDEWIGRGDVSLERLVAHVLIHEVGHHFGLSDADMAALEEGG